MIKTDGVLFHEKLSCRAMRQILAGKILTAYSFCLYLLYMHQHMFTAIHFWLMKYRNNSEIQFRYVYVIALICIYACCHTPCLPACLPACPPPRRHKGAGFYMTDEPRNKHTEPISVVNMNGSLSVCIPLCMQLFDLLQRTRRARWNWNALHDLISF